MFVYAATTRVERGGGKERRRKEPCIEEREGVRERDGLNNIERGRNKGRKWIKMRDIAR